MPWGVTLPRIGEFNPGAQAGMIKGIEPEFQAGRWRWHGEDFAQGRMGGEKATSRSESESKRRINTPAQIRSPNCCEAGSGFQFFPQEGQRAKSFCQHHRGRPAIQNICGRSRPTGQPCLTGRPTIQNDCRRSPTPVVIKNR